MLRAIPAVLLSLWLFFHSAIAEPDPNCNLHMCRCMIFDLVIQNHTQVQSLTNVPFEIVEGRYCCYYLKTTKTAVAAPPSGVHETVIFLLITPSRTDCYKVIKNLNGNLLCRLFMFLAYLLYCNACKTG